MLIAVPRGAKSELSGAEFQIAIGWKVSVQVRRVREPAPRDAEGVADYFDRLDFTSKRQLLQIGQTGDVPFTVRRYQVRLGERHGDTMVHRLEWVTRVYATLPLDAGSHALCTGYLEYEADPDDPELDKVLAVCRSMQRGQ